MLPINTWAFPSVSMTILLFDLFFSVFFRFDGKRERKMRSRGWGEGRYGDDKAVWEIIDVSFTFFFFSARILETGV